MRRTMIVIVAMAGLAACSEQLYGTGVVYVWNGTGLKAEVSLDGRTMARVSLGPESGELLRDVIAGPYQLAMMKGGAVAGVVGTEVVRDRLTIVNIDAAACFARVDIAGLYNRNAPPSVLKEIYQGQAVFSIPEEIGVLPGERPPDSRQKSAFGFFRIAVVPCKLAKGNELVLEDYLQKLK